MTALQKEIFKSAGSGTYNFNRSRLSQTLFGIYLIYFFKSQHYFWRFPLFAQNCAMLVSKK
jgi:hypothetical protein